MLWLFPGLGRLSLPVNLQCARELLLRIKAVKPVELQTDFLGCGSWFPGVKDTGLFESGKSKESLKRWIGFAHLLAAVERILSEH